MLDLPLYASQGVAQARFTFRTIRALHPGLPDGDDIDAVTSLSHRSRNIRRANPDLTEAGRRALYTRWYAANPDCFLLLERTEPGAGEALVIANTAMLPLKQAAFDRLRWGTSSVLNLDASDIMTKGTAHDVLLFDTWVAASQYMGKAQHHGYVYALIYKHLSLFLGTNAPHSLTVAVEPDAPVISDIIQWFEFYKVPKTKGTRLGMWQLHYPGGVDPANIAIVNQALCNVSTCASWGP